MSDLWFHQARCLSLDVKQDRSLLELRAVGGRWSRGFGREEEALLMTLSSPGRGCSNIVTRWTEDRIRGVNSTVLGRPALPWFLS